MKRLILNPQFAMLEAEINFLNGLPKNEPSAKITGTDARQIGQIYYKYFGTTELSKLQQKEGTWEGLQFAGRNADMSPIYKDEIRPSREISVVQTNAIALKTLKPDGTLQDQWLQWPKAKECEFMDDKCIIYENDNEGKRIKVLTYWFLIS